MTRALIITITAIITLYVFLAGSVSAHPAWGIVVDRNNQIYFSDLETIWKIDAQGKLTVFRAGVSGRHIHELTMDEGGNLYGADYTYEPETQRYINAIWKMTPAGAFTYLLAPTDNPSQGISIWRDCRGNMYSVEQNNHTKRETLLMRRTPDGSVTRLAGGSYGHADGQGRAAKFQSVNGMAWGMDGALYLADDMSVRRVAMDGTVKTLAADLDKKALDNVSGDEDSYGGLMGITIDAAGNVYVADYRNRRVVKIDSAGKVSTIVRAEPPFSPTGVTMDKRGNLYVLEVGFTPPRTFSGPRVRKFARDGHLTTLATVGQAEKSEARRLVRDREIEMPSVTGAVVKSRVAAISFGMCAVCLIVWRKHKR